MNKKFLSVILSASMVLAPMGGRSCFAQEDNLTLTKEDETVSDQLYNCNRRLGECFVKKAKAKDNLIKYIGIDGIDEVNKFMTNFTSNCDDKLNCCYDKLRKCYLKEGLYQSELWIHKKPNKFIVCIDALNKKLHKFIVCIDALNKKLLMH